MNELQTLEKPAPEAELPGFGSAAGFDLIQRIARAFASSTLVPASYRSYVEDKNGVVKENPAAIGNCMVALNMAARLKADPLMVAQNLHVIEGRPSWSSQFVISAINSSGKFSPLRFEMTPEGVEKEVEYTTYEWSGAPGQRVKQAKTHKVRVRARECYAWAIERGTGERLSGPTVSMDLAVKEGWLTKNGSKWQTMPEMMLMYRSAAFFGRLYAPEILMGLMTAEEAHDIPPLIPMEPLPIPSSSPAPALASSEPEPKAKPATGAEKMAAKVAEKVTRPVAPKVEPLVVAPTKTPAPAAETPFDSPSDSPSPAMTNKEKLLITVRERLDASGVTEATLLRFAREGLGVLNAKHLPNLTEADLAHIVECYDDFLPSLT